MPRSDVTINLVELDPKAPTRETWAQYHAYRRLRQHETRPEDPMLPDEMVEKDWLQENPYDEERVLLVEQDGQFIASLHAGRSLPASPGYETNKQYHYAGGHVLKPYRRRGIGTALTRHLVRLMEEAGTTVLTTGTEEPDGHAFLKWLGAEEKLTGAENRLDLHAVDWAMLEKWVADGRSRSPDTQLVFYEHRVPEEAMPAVTQALSEMLNTMPFDDLDHGEIVVTPETMQIQYYQWMDNVNGEHYLYMTVEPDGTISGMTDTNYIPAKPDRIGQMFTGVRPTCRGRGLGKLLKASMLLFIRERYPDARWVVTNNANSNDPMLAINRQMGFKTYRSGSDYQISREKLAEFLAGV